MVDNTIRVNIEDMPVPPPWELGEDGRYHNTITDEFIDFHPLRKLFMSNQANEPQVESPLPIMPQLSSIAQTEGVDNTQHISSSSSRSSSMFPSLNPQLESIAAPNSTSKPEFLTKRPKSFADFRCYWKEVGLFGKVNSYTVLIRYYQDCSVDVKFNGIDGIWQYSHLEGPYGVLDRLDMFIGAKINLFGRHLTISSASASLCHEIELEGKRLLKRQDFLRSKIESVAAVPIVRKKETSSRGKAEGHTNLRQIHNENCRLGEQLAQLGLSHFIALADETYGTNHFEWMNVKLPSVHSSVYHA